MPEEEKNKSISQSFELLLGAATLLHLFWRKIIQSLNQRDDAGVVKDGGDFVHL